jgi:hypothetical protein
MKHPPFPSFAWRNNLLNYEMGSLDCPSRQIEHASLSCRFVATIERFLRQSLNSGRLD